jgi:hypothetical protein
MNGLTQDLWNHLKKEVKPGKGKKKKKKKGGKKKGK